jgi:hypothetical protein
MKESNRYNSKHFYHMRELLNWMPEDTFSYQVLMDAVFAATEARGSVCPDHSNYMAISLDTVKSIVASFDSKPSSS